MKKRLKIGIIGHGFVGKATDSGFNIDVEKFIVDPKYKTTIEDLKEFSPNVIFVCVPTPMGEDGSQNSEIIESVTEETARLMPDCIIVIKSTVLPNILIKLSEFSKNLIYNPEFLREKHANEDFINSKMIIFGGDRNISEKISGFYRNHTKCTTEDHIFVDLLSASFIKYTINTFLATKVIFFNEMHALYMKIKSNDPWEKIINTVALDERIGKSHMDVPGHDGRYGFGGACFPKDSLALIKYAIENDMSIEVLKAAVKKNNTIRGSYLSLDQREVEQNISFDDNI